MLAGLEQVQLCRNLPLWGIFMLTPKSEATDDWSYVTKKVADVGVDVGRPSIADVDLDGFADIFVPLYNAKKVAHYTFTSAQSEIQIWSFRALTWVKGVGYPW